MEEDQTQVLHEQGLRCSICGIAPEYNDLKSLHVHEIEKYDFHSGICELVDLNLICKKCHSFHHMGRTEMLSTKVQLEELIQHFMRVNDCNYFDYKDHYLEAQVKLGNLHRKPTFEKVQYAISGKIPYKEEVIKQLKEKDIYYDLPSSLGLHTTKKSNKVIKVYKKHGTWNVECNGYVKKSSISKKNALQEARNLIAWNDYDTNIEVFNVNGDLVKTY